MLPCKDGLSPTHLVPLSAAQRQVLAPPFRRFQTKTFLARLSSPLTKPAGHWSVQDRGRDTALVFEPTNNSLIVWIYLQKGFELEKHAVRFDVSVEHREQAQVTGGV